MAIFTKRFSLIYTFTDDSYLSCTLMHINSVTLVQYAKKINHSVPKDLVFSVFLFGTYERFDLGTPEYVLF